MQHIKCRSVGWQMVASILLVSVVAFAQPPAAGGRRWAYER